jgi:hypothetical protein
MFSGNGRREKCVIATDTFVRCCSICCWLRANVGPHLLMACNCVGGHSCKEPWVWGCQASTTTWTETKGTAYVFFDQLLASSSKQVLEVNRGLWFAACQPGSVVFYRWQFLSLGFCIFSVMNLCICGLVAYAWESVLRDLEVAICCSSVIHYQLAKQQLCSFAF